MTPQAQLVYNWVITHVMRLYNNELFEGSSFKKYSFWRKNWALFKVFHAVIKIAICCSLRKKEEPKRLLLRSRLLVRNSAPLEALFWCHLQRWSRFKQQKKVGNSSTVLRGAILAPLFFSMKYHYLSDNWSFVLLLMYE